MHNVEMATTAAAQVVCTGALESNQWLSFYYCNESAVVLVLAFALVLALAFALGAGGGRG